MTRLEALQAVTELAALAAEQTPEAMERLCDLGPGACEGFSGVVLHDPDGPASAPGPDDPPEVLCDYDVGSGWMVVVEGNDGYGRPYVSQVAVNRSDGVAVPREAAFWLGVSYVGPRSTGHWSTAYHPSIQVAAEHTREMLDRARRACDEV